MKEEFNIYVDVPKPGHPRTFTPRWERNIVRLIQSGKCRTVIKVQNHLKDEEHVTTGVVTVKRVFRRNGLHGSIKRSKPLLCVKHRQSSLRFARNYRDWTTKDWSDESKFKLFRLDGREYTWRRPCEELQPR